MESRGDCRCSIAVVSVRRSAEPLSGSGSGVRTPRGARQPALRSGVFRLSQHALRVKRVELREQRRGVWKRRGERRRPLVLRPRRARGRARSAVETASPELAVLSGLGANRILGECGHLSRNLRHGPGHRDTRRLAGHVAYVARDPVTNGCGTAWVVVTQRLASVHGMRFDTGRDVHPALMAAIFPGEEPAVDHHAAPSDTSTLVRGALAWRSPRGRTRYGLNCLPGACSCAARAPPRAVRCEADNPWRRPHVFHDVCPRRAGYTASKPTSTTPCLTSVDAKASLIACASLSSSDLSRCGGSALRVQPSPA